MEWLKSIAPQNFVLTSTYLAGLVLLGLAAFFGLTKGGNAMAVATVTPVTEVRIPEIDTEVTEDTETATFSLG